MDSFFVFCWKIVVCICYKLFAGIVCIGVIYYKSTVCGFMNKIEDFDSGNLGFFGSWKWILHAYFGGEAKKNQKFLSWITSF